jgi:hypothetical protein
MPRQCARTAPQRPVWRAVTGLGGAAIGQFSPLSGGGPNTGSAFEGAGNVNPWNFIRCWRAR